MEIERERYWGADTPFPSNFFNSPEKLNVIFEEESDTRFYIIMMLKFNLVKTLIIDTARTHSYAEQKIIEKLELKIFSTSNE